MNQSPQNNVTKALKKTRAKPPLEINLVGPVGELVAAEFANGRLQGDRLETVLESYKKQIEQLVEQTRYPIKIYTEEDFKNLFMVEKRTQLNYRKQGKLDFIKPGEKVLYTQQHIDKFIARFDSRNSRNRGK